MSSSVTKNEFFFLSSNGKTQIHGIEWLPNAPVKAVLQLAHGVAEHIDRYDSFASFMASQGFAVAGNDHLGHGLSVQNESQRGYFGPVGGWDLVVKDMKKLRDILAEKYPGKPLFLLGHSMGSFLSRTYLPLYPDDFRAVILSGTGQQPPLICRAGQLLAKMIIRRHGPTHPSESLQKIAFGSYLDRIEEPVGPNDWLSRDAAVVQRYSEDPLCGYTVSAALMRDMMEGLVRIQNKDFLSSMRKLMPVLFLSGEEDPVGDWGDGVKKVAAMFIALGMRDVSVKLYPDGRHEMLNELNKDDVYKDILDWLSDKL